MEAWFELHCKCDGSPGNVLKAKDSMTANAIRHGELSAKCGKCLTDIVFKEVASA